MTLWLLIKFTVAKKNWNCLHCLFWSGLVWGPWSCKFSYCEFSYDSHFHLITLLIRNLHFSVWNWQCARDNIHYLFVMDQILIDDNLSESGVNVDIPLRNTNNEEKKSNKCNQCGYSSSMKSTLRRHLKIHSVEKSNKCNQCDFASSHARSLKANLKTHSGEKSNKCNQCDYASSWAGNLRTHLKTHSGEKSN